VFAFALVDGQTILLHVPEQLGLSLRILLRTGFIAVRIPSSDKSAGYGLVLLVQQDQWRTWLTYHQYEWFG
jgi:hypothetical protein